MSKDDSFDPYGQGQRKGEKAPSVTQKLRCAWDATLQAPIRANLQRNSVVIT